MRPQKPYVAVRAGLCLPTFTRRSRLWSTDAASNTPRSSADTRSPRANRSSWRCRWPCTTLETPRNFPF